MRSLAQKMSIYGTAVRNMVLEDLSYKSYDARRGQFMSETNKSTQARHKENLGPDPLDQEGDGVPRQGHHGKDIQEVRGNKCPRHHNLKTVKNREIMFE
jgi:hypothetical protein